MKQWPRCKKCRTPLHADLTFHMFVCPTCNEWRKDKSEVVYDNPCAPADPADAYHTPDRTMEVPG